MCVVALLAAPRRLAGGTEGSKDQPPPPTPHGAGTSLVTLVSYSLVFVVIYMLLSSKCQGQCLIHAVPPTLLGTEEKLKTHSLD